MIENIFETAMTARREYSKYLEGHTIGLGGISKADLQFIPWKINSGALNVDQLFFEICNRTGMYISSCERHYCTTSNEHASLTSSVRH